MLIWRAALPNVDEPVLLPYRKGCWQARRFSESDEDRAAAAGDHMHMGFCHSLLDKNPVTVIWLP